MVLNVFYIYEIWRESVMEQIALLGFCWWGTTESLSVLYSYSSIYRSDIVVR